MPEGKAREYASDTQNSELDASLTAHAELAEELDSDLLRVSLAAQIHTAEKTTAEPDNQHQLASAPLGQLPGPSSHSLDPDATIPLESYRKDAILYLLVWISSVMLAFGAGVVFGRGGL
jgi:hypothetical protein